MTVTDVARGVPHGEAEERHVSFCKQSAAGQPQDVLNR
jgi:hypothetical protein